MCLPQVIIYTCMKTSQISYSPFTNFTSLLRPFAEARAGRPFMGSWIRSFGRQMAPAVANGFQRNDSTTQQQFGGRQAAHSVAAA